MLAFSRFLQRFITDTHVFFALKVSCALAIVLLPGLYLDMIHETVAMSLGIVAGAIAEPDDSLSGRIKSLLLTLACFWIATLSVQLLFPYPWLFAAGLFSSTWFFIMLGGLGKRYSSISFGSLLVAVYSMMGAAQAPTIWFQPVWLCTGALWYGFISLCWLRATPNKPLREQLAQTCFSLARYCTQKAWLFPSSADEQPSIHQKLAILNVDCMTSINLCQEMIARRSEHPDQELQQLIALQAQGDKTVRVFFILRGDKRDTAQQPTHKFAQLGVALCRALGQAGVGNDQRNFTLMQGRDHIRPQLGLHHNNQLGLDGVEEAVHGAGQIVRQVDVMNVFTEGGHRSLGAGWRHGSNGDRQIGITMT